MATRSPTSAPLLTARNDSDLSFSPNAYIPSGTAHISSLIRTANNYAVALKNPSSPINSFLNYLRSSHSGLHGQKDELHSILDSEQRDLLSVGAAHPVFHELLSQGRHQDVDLLHGYLASMVHLSSSPRSSRILPPSPRISLDTLESTFHSQAPPAYTSTNEESEPPAYAIGAGSPDATRRVLSMDTRPSYTSDTDVSDWSPYPSTPATAPRTNTYSWADLSSSNSASSKPISSTMERVEAAHELETTASTRVTDTATSAPNTLVEVDATSRPVYELGSINSGTGLYELDTSQPFHGRFVQRYLNGTETGSLGAGTKRIVGIYKLPASQHNTNISQLIPSVPTKLRKSVKFVPSAKNSSLSRHTRRKKQRGKILKFCRRFLNPSGFAMQSTAPSRKGRGSSSRPTRRSLSCSITSGRTDTDKSRVGTAVSCYHSSSSLRPIRLDRGGLPRCATTMERGSFA